MSLVDDSILRTMGELVPLMPLRLRLETIQHDHITELPEILAEVERGRHSLSLTLASLPEARSEQYWRVYADLLWAATMMLASIADAENRGMQEAVPHGA